MALTGFATSAQELKARGVIQARAQTTLATELVAKVKNLPIAEGQRFREGDVLVDFDCGRYRAEYAAARAAAKAERALSDQARTLKKFRAGGKTAVIVGEAKADRAAAEARALEITIQQCEIKAPYPGRVVEWLVQQHELPSANQPLIKIVDDSQLEVETLIPSKWLRWLKTGANFKFDVDETGKSYNVRVKQIAAVVDPVSQRIRIKAEFVSDSDNVLAGMSGVARFNPETE